MAAPAISVDEPDHHCVWSPVEDLSDGSVVYRCIVEDRCPDVVFGLDGTAVPVEEVAP